MTASSDRSPPQQRQLPLPSLEDYRLLVESIVDYGVFLLDPAGHIASWNRGAERIKGYAAHEIVGKHFSTFYPAEDVEALRDASGELRGFAKVTRDLSQRRAAEEELRRSEEGGGHARRGEYAARARPCRARRGAVLGWASMLDGTVADAKVAKGLAVIHRNACAQTKIIEDILDVSRIITGKLRLELLSVDLVKIVRDAMEVVRPSADAKSITLALRSPPEPCLLIADPDRLQQVVWNLLSSRQVHRRRWDDHCRRHM